MELTRRNFLKVGGSVFGGTAVLGLAGCVSPEVRQQGEGTGPIALRPADLEYVIQFQHPEKMLARLPTQPEITDAMIAPFFGVNANVYEEIRAGFAVRAREAALELLENFDFRERVDRLPFEAGTTVVGLGDNITDDLQSWFEILRNLVEERRPRDEIRFVNAGITGDTTPQIISRFLRDVVEQGPAWIISMMGTNDVRRHGEDPTKILVSHDETEANLNMIRNFAEEQTRANRIWMTPTPVIEDRISDSPFLASQQLMWRNEDLEEVADIVRRIDDPVVDLQDVIRDPVDPELILPDGLNPSLEGQQTIAAALVERLAEGRGR
jgi:lysophospholipase L1-like esterase